MKKILLISLMLSVLLLGGCKEKTVGGYTKPKSSKITAELQEKFDTAFEGLDGASYTPSKLLGTQVVAGTNYKFEAKMQAISPNAKQQTVIVVIYEDLNGNLSITSIENK